MIVLKIEIDRRSFEAYKTRL